MQVSVRNAGIMRVFLPKNPHMPVNTHLCGYVGNTAQSLIYITELDGVGPVDNRPSTDKLHHFVRNKKKKKEEEKNNNNNWTCDM